MKFVQLNVWKVIEMKKFEVCKQIYFKYMKEKSETDAKIKPNNIIFDRL